MYLGKNFTSYLFTVIILGPHHNLPHHLTPLGSCEECFTIFDDKSTQYERAVRHMWKTVCSVSYLVNILVNYHPLSILLKCSPWPGNVFNFLLASAN